MDPCLAMISVLFFLRILYFCSFFFRAPADLPPRSSVRGVDRLREPENQNVGMSLKLIVHWMVDFVSSVPSVLNLRHCAGAGEEMRVVSCDEQRGTRQGMPCQPFS
jgi:hypothetical protein